MKNQDLYHDVATAETLDKFRRVLMNVFDGDAKSNLPSKTNDILAVILKPLQEKT